MIGILIFSNVTHKTKSHGCNINLSQDFNFIISIWSLSIHIFESIKVCLAFLYILNVFHNLKSKLAGQTWSKIEYFKEDIIQISQDFILVIISESDKIIFNTLKNN